MRMGECSKDDPQPLPNPSISLKQATKEIPKNFKCYFLKCDKAFTRAWKLEAHIHSQHNKVSPYVCSFGGCDRRYNSKSHLQRHHKTFHLGVVLPCTYSDCPTTFTTSWALKMHCKEMHDQKGTFFCNLCDAVFIKQSYLERHLEWHKEQASLVCPVCSKKWRRDSLLRRHMKSHIMKKCPYDDCEFAGDSQKKLRKHMAIVHPPVYDCFHCGRRYKVKPALRDHVMQHFPVKERMAFPCPHRQCDRAYLHERNLKQHIASFHLKERYYCDEPLCKYSSVDPTALHGHKLNGHKKAARRKRKEAIINRLTASALIEDDEESNLKMDSSPREEPNISNTLFVVSRDHVLV